MTMRVLAVHSFRSEVFRRASWWRPLLRALTIMLGLMATSAYAGNCRYTGDSPTFITASPTMSGSITVGRDAPLGTVLYRATYWTTSSFVLYCEAGAYTYEKKYRTTPFPVSGFSRPDRAGPVYQTSIPGIGVQVWSSSPGLPVTAGSFNFSVGTTEALTSDNGLSGWLSFDVEIIKISDATGAGVLRGTDLPTIEFGMQGGNFLTTLAGSVGGSLNVVARTCATPDVTVDLGTHSTGELSGVGTTTGTWVDVPIKLNNCPGFFGYRSTRFLADDGSTTDGLIRSNSISFDVSPTTSVVVPSQGVMALRPDGANPTATGIGIQLAFANERPIQYDVATGSGLTLSQTDGASYVIPLKARYYQTAATVTAGQANGEATISLIYD